MKRYFALGLISVILLTGGATVLDGQRASAHVLLPENVVQYIKANPDASPGEIKDYIKKSSPELNEKIKSEQNVIDIVNQKTSFLDNTYDFMKLGLRHILSGSDHILFVLSLLLVFAGIRNILKFTATFTVAHSITLILAGSGILTLSSGIVEPVIALSIAVVALTSVFLRNNKYFGDIRSKLGVIFFFGLFHGLGFAGLLKEIQVPPDKFLYSLVSFNIGIELGQLVIVAMALPAIYLFHNKKYYPHVIKLLALIIAAIALTWMVQRIRVG